MPPDDSARDRAATDSAPAAHILRMCHVPVNAVVMHELLTKAMQNLDQALDLRQQGLVHLPALAAMHGGIVPVRLQKHAVEGRWHAQAPFALQSLPRTLRPAITVTAANRVLLYGDWRACHWQILAYRSGDAQMISDIERGDFYGTFRPPGLEDLDPAAVKRCANAYLNGGRQTGFEPHIGGGEKARRLLDYTKSLFAARWQRADAWLRGAARHEVESGRIAASRAYTAAGNALRRIESDMLETVLLNPGFAEAGLSLILPMHDGLLCEVDADRATDAARWLRETMAVTVTGATHSPAGSVALHADVAQYLRSWGGDNDPLIGRDLHKIANQSLMSPDAENPLGLLLAASCFADGLAAASKAHHAASKVARAIRLAALNAREARSWENAHAPDIRAHGGRDILDFDRRENKDGSPGEIKDTPGNLLLMLEHDYALWWNERDGKMYQGQRRVALDDWWAEVLETAQVRHGWPCRMSKDLVISLSHRVAQRTTRNPHTDEIDSLIWDGAPRVDTWLSHVIYEPFRKHRLYRPELAIPDYEEKMTNLYGRLLLVGMMARLYAPGPRCKMDTMLVLAGAQSAGKQLLWQALAGESPQGQSYYCGGFPAGTKETDVIQAKQRCWVYEDQEMAAYSAKEVEEIKKNMSRAEDDARFAYGRESAPVARRYVHVGSTNDPTGLLRDSTGSRRFWVVEIPSFAGGEITDIVRIDVEWMRQNRNQLLAEARDLYRAGAQHWIDSGSVEAAMQDRLNRAKFTHEDLIDVHARRMFDAAQEGEIHAFTTHHFLSDFDPNFTPLDSVRGRAGRAAANALRAAGFVQGRVLTADGRSKERRWFKPRKPTPVGVDETLPF